MSDPVDLCSENLKCLKKKNGLSLKIEPRALGGLHQLSKAVTNLRVKMAGLYFDFEK